MMTVKSFALLLPCPLSFSCLQASHEGVQGPREPSYDEQDTDAEAQCQMNACHNAIYVK